MKQNYQDNQMQFFDQLFLEDFSHIPETFYTQWKLYDNESKPTLEDYLKYWESKIQQYDLSNMIGQLLKGLCERRMSNKFLNVASQFAITHSNVVREKVFLKEELLNKNFDSFFSKKIRVLHNLINENMLQQTHLIELNQLEVLVKNNEVGKHIDKLIDKKEFFSAYRFMRAFQYEKHSYKELVNQMPLDEFKLARKIISEVGLDINQHKKIKQKLALEALNYLMYKKELPYEKLEELLFENKILLELFIKQGFSRMPQKMIQVAKRNNITIDDEEIQQQISQFNGEIKKNRLFSLDAFGTLTISFLVPTELILVRKRQQPEDTYIKLSDFNIYEKDVILIEDERQLTDEIIQDIVNSQVTGIDTESFGDQPQTKFSKSLKLCLLQIALPNKIYLLNSFKLKSSEKYKTFVNLFFQNGKKKVGQGLEQDIFLVLRDVQLKTIQVKDMIELMTLFKTKFPNEFKSNLALQCKKLLNKELSKIEQISNWNQRPLRKAQIHYAALDAYICLYLYQNFYQK